MAAGGASLLAFAIFSMLVMSSLGDPRPLCSNCETLCRTKGNAVVESTCGNFCDYNLSPQANCRSELLERCTADGTCCSSNGTCTCDCNNVVRDRCYEINCEGCKRDMFNMSYRACNDDCKNKCKKKGCHA
uniref:Uncharacterized protein n=1 Tax=Hordeum vulgare subsp. vulgare TaxID=112509 RepID=A0A8I6WVL0_HORVV